MCRDLLSRWQLPVQLPVGGRQVPIRADYRDVLRVFACLNDEQLPVFARWRKALRLFYVQPVAAHQRQEAMERLKDFVTCYQEATPGPKLMDWNHDAQLIAAEINKVAGREVRDGAFVHWWTFLGWFNAISPGPFAQVVAVREKLATGKKLSDQDRRFYRAWRDQIRLPDGSRVQEEKQQLEQLLKGGGHGKDYQS